MAIDLGYISDGYAWLFPKSDHLSIGIACLERRTKGLKHSYWRFLNSLNLGRYTIARWSGGLIPVCTGQPVVARGRVALLGDAASLGDSLTGEGIYNAVLSARLAAPIFEKAVLNGEADLLDYQRAIEEEIVPQMRVAHSFSRVLGLVPARLFELIAADDRIWKAGCSLLRGETSYTLIRDRISTLGGLYALMFRK
jgi:flavin-dependent dehydrogenase